MPELLIGDVELPQYMPEPMVILPIEPNVYLDPLEPLSPITGPANPSQESSESSGCAGLIVLIILAAIVIWYLVTYGFPGQ